MKHGKSWGSALGLCLCLLAACQQPSKQTPKDTSDDTDAQFVAPAPKAWTDAFLKKSILFADEIYVEGPQGIIDKTAMRIEPEIMDSSTRTTKDGLLQEAHMKSDAGGEVHAYLNNWELVGFRRIRILERVAPCDVKVRASGAARFVDVGSGAEKNGDSLEFEGKIPR
jgi:hypothetical protein